MLLDQLRTLPDSLVARLDPVRVQEYVRAAGWLSRPLSDDSQSALYQRPESKREQILIPLSHELADFAPRMAEAVAYLARYEKRPAHELLADLLLPDSDVLRFRESSATAATGDVPFDHGMAMLAGARKALLASACSVIRPATFYPRMSLAEAEQFLASCRLGQTERGSFILTVACPLDAVPAEPDLFDAPFTRRVTELLMRSLYRLAHALELGDTDAVLREAENEPTLSANLCEGLLDMAPEGEDSFLQVSADFSGSLASTARVPAPKAVRLRREIFPRIETVATRLRPATAPKRQLHIGYVETLNGRPNAEGRLEGQVTLRLMTTDSDSVRARADLSVEDYARADQAHMANRPVSLEGELRQSGRTYRLDRPARFRIIIQDTSSETPT